MVDESGILLTADVLRAGFSKPSLYKFLRENDFEQVGHGVYASPDAWADENYILSLRCPNAVFSHDEALYHYGLIDHEPQRRTITVYTGYGTAGLLKSLRQLGIRFRNLKDSAFSLQDSYNPGVNSLALLFRHLIP